jgi:hypothetical protein
MANTITNQTIMDGERNLVVKVQILGDNSGDETVANIVNMSTYNNGTYGPIVALKIMAIKANLNGFAAQLIWDASANVKCMDIPDGDSDFDYRKFGGLINNAGSGVTGDILLATTGLAVEQGTIIIEMAKKY